MPLFNFAYGSNLWLPQMKERVPSARFVAVAELREYTLRFHKRSSDGSAKANVFKTGSDSDRVLGAIYEFEEKDLASLDEHEGRGKGYEREELAVVVDGHERRAFVYVASPGAIDDSIKPYSWYVRLVVAGAELHRLPDDYAEAIRRVSSTEDIDLNRARRRLATLGDVE